MPLKPKLASGCVVEVKAKAVGVGGRTASAQSSGGVAEGPSILQAELPQVRSASDRIVLCTTRSPSCLAPRWHVCNALSKQKNIFII